MRVLLFSLCVAFLLAVSGAAQAQSNDVRALYDRVDRLERDIQTLQAQLARGDTSALVVTSPTATHSANGGGGGAIGTSDRLDSLESQIQTMTGKLEEANHRAMLNAKQLERLQADMDLRFKELQSPASQTSPPQTMGPQTTGDAQPPGQVPGQAGDKGASLQMPAVTAGAEGGKPPMPPNNSAENPGLAPGPQVLGTIPAKDIKKGPDVVPEAPAPTKEAAKEAVAKELKDLAAPKDPKAAYNAAYAQFQARDFAGALTAFKSFIAKFPEHQLVPSAIYWEGESAYAQEDYKTAASYFGEGFRKYPNATKAPDLLFKLGQSFGQLKMTKEACRAYKLLSETFPDLSSRLKKASSAERSKLGC